MSDVHLGYAHSNRDDFLKFLEDVAGTLDKSDSLVFLGDIFDFWRGKNVEIALDNESILEKIQDVPAQLYFVPGNHDYTLATLNVFGSSFLKIQKSVTLQDGGSVFSFIHGYQLEVLANLEPLTVEEYETLCTSLCQRTGDFPGDLLSVLWDTLQLSFKRGDRRKDMVHSIGDVPEKRKDMQMVDRLARSSARCMFLGLGREDNLIFGHTHRPFVDEHIANTGSWVSDSQMQNTYITIEEGKTQLKQFEIKQ